MANEQKRWRHGILAEGHWFNFEHDFRPDDEHRTVIELGLRVLEATQGWPLSDSEEED